MIRNVLLLLVIGVTGTSMFFSTTIDAAGPKTVPVAPGNDKEVTFTTADQDQQGFYTLDITPDGPKLNTSSKILGPGKALWNGPHGAGDPQAPPTEDLHEYTIQRPPGELPLGVLIKGDFKLEGGGTGTTKNEFTVDVQDALTVEITTADVTTDNIHVKLGSSGLSGMLRLELRGPGSPHTILEETRASGEYDESFNIPNLPTGEYTTVRATWTVTAEGQQVSESDDHPYHTSIMRENLVF